MPLPADATEFVDAPTIECDALAWVAFKLVLLGDHCVKSSSTISVSFFRHQKRHQPVNGTQK